MGVWEAISIVNLIERLARKLRRIMFHFGPVAFRIHFGETRQPIIFIFSDLVHVSMTRKTNDLQL